jgi:hypothetical protein
MCVFVCVRAEPEAAAAAPRHSHSGLHLQLALLAESATARAGLTTVGGSDTPVVVSITLYRREGAPATTADKYVTGVVHRLEQWSRHRRSAAADPPPRDASTPDAFVVLHGGGLSAQQLAAVSAAVAACVLPAVFVDVVLAEGVARDAGGGGDGGVGGAHVGNMGALLRFLAIARWPALPPPPPPAGASGAVTAVGNGGEHSVDVTYDGRLVGDGSDGDAPCFWPACCATVQGAAAAPRVAIALQDAEFGVPAQNDTRALCVVGHAGGRVGPSAPPADVVELVFADPVRRARGGGGGGGGSRGARRWRW